MDKPSGTRLVVIASMVLIAIVGVFNVVKGNSGYGILVVSVAAVIVLLAIFLPERSRPSNKP